MKQNLKLAAAFFLSAAIAWAGTIKVWGTNDVLTAADLNANFAHIHNLMVGGHGPRLVNADVASGAAIAYTKVVASPYAPTAWGLIDTSSCAPDGGTCAVTGLGTTSAIQNGTGVYYLTLTTSPDITLVNAGYPTSVDCVANNSANPVVIQCSSAPSTSIRFVSFNQ